MSEEKKGGCRGVAGIFVGLLLALALLGLIIQGIQKGVETIKGPAPTAKEEGQPKKEPEVASVQERPKPEPPLPKPEPPPLTSAQKLAEGKKALAEKPKIMPYGNLGAAENYLKGIPQESKEFKEAQRLLKEVEQRRQKAMAIGLKEFEKSMATKRKEMADELENRYLSKGMDITVKVGGPQNTVITLKYVLFNRAMVYQLGNQTNMLNDLKNLGFKKAVFVGAFRESWTYDLNK